jgi:hypothetical protein
LHNISAHDYAQETCLNCSAAMMVAMVTVLKMTIMMEIDLMITNWSLYTPLSKETNKLIPLNSIVPKMFTEITPLIMLQ